MPRPTKTGSDFLWIVLVSIAVMAICMPYGRNEVTPDINHHGGALRVLIVHHAIQRPALPHEMVSGWYSKDIRDWADENCDKDADGSTAFKVLDIDGETDWGTVDSCYRDVVKEHPPLEPATIYVTDGVHGASGYPPPNPEELKSLLAKWKGVSGTVPRSGKWPAVRDAYLKKHPHCEFKGCTNPDTPEVHHKKPFHTHPELELDPSNLKSLCRTGENHHLYVGHNGDFGGINPNVDEDCKCGTYSAKGLERKRRHEALKTIMAP